MQREGAWGYVMAPVTLVTIATWLREDGHEVKVLDAPARRLGFEAMLAEARAWAPELVLVNTSTPSIEDDVEAARRVRAGTSRPPVTALLGIHPTVLHAELLGEGVDCCIVGEPEVTARELAARLGRGEPVEGLPGLAWRDAAGAPRLGPPRQPLQDLDALPIPDWSLVEVGDYRLPHNDEPFLLVATNRGCANACSFCNAHVYYGRAPRQRSPAHVVRELRAGVERFGVRQYMFWAEEFVVEPGWVIALCDAIAAAGLRISWVCNSRVDAVTPEVLAALRRAGCWNVAYGIESGSQEVLDAVGKRTTVARIREAVAMTREAGLQVTGHVIIGFPEDTRASVDATRRLVDELDLDFVQFYCAMPLPGTRLRGAAEAQGWITDRAWSRLEHNFSVLDAGRLRPAEIMALRRRLMLRWYASPRRVLRILRNHVRRPRDLWALLSRVGGFLRWM